MFRFSFGRLTVIATVTLSVVAFHFTGTSLAVEPGGEPGELTLDEVEQIVKDEVQKELKRRGIGGSSGGSNLCILERKTYSEGAEVGEQTCRNGVWH